MNQNARVRNDMIRLLAQQRPQGQGGTMQPEDIDAAFVGLPTGNQEVPAVSVYIFCSLDGPENAPETMVPNSVREQFNHIVRCPAAGRNRFLTPYAARQHHTAGNATICAQCRDACLD